MNQRLRDASKSLDQSLTDLLAEQMHCEVLLVYPKATLRPKLLEIGIDQERLMELAVARAPRPAMLASSQSDQSALALQLPLGGMAIWRVDSRYAHGSAAHAATILELQSTRFERDQLLAESEALATQVVNDFEELMLIRSLASSMEIPSSKTHPNELAIKLLRPLAEGVGAASIAAVFLSEDGLAMSPPCWSGPEVTTTDSLHRLIDTYREEAERRPIVRNDLDKSGRDRVAPAITEFMMVQCRSEGRLHGWLVACNRVEDKHQTVPWAQLGFTTVQASLLKTTTHQLAAQLHNLRLLHQKETLFTEVVRALVNAVEARDPNTSGHSERVAWFARFLGETMGLSTSDCERIYLTGLLHDVGKIAVPDGVLQKPGHLDDEERAIIETHTEAGWRILHELDALRDVLPGVLYHHERFDGHGYPDGLAGEAIPLDGRILAVCDAFDAMTSDRPYREGMPVEKAVEILQEGSGRIWDPKLISMFVRNLEEINQIRREHRPRELAQRTAPSAP